MQELIDRSIADATDANNAHILTEALLALLGMTSQRSNIHLEIEAQTYAALDRSGTLSVRDMECARRCVGPGGDIQELVMRYRIAYIFPLALLRQWRESTSMQLRAALSFHGYIEEMEYSSTDTSARVTIQLRSTRVGAWLIDRAIAIARTVQPATILINMPPPQRQVYHAKRVAAQNGDDTPGVLAGLRGKINNLFFAESPPDVPTNRKRERDEK